MEQKKTDLKTKAKSALQYLAGCMHFRSKPGCMTCMSPIMDRDGKPIVPNTPTEK